MSKLSRKVLAWALPLAFALAAAMPAVAFAGEVSVSSAGDLKTALQDTTNHEVVLENDITVSSNISVGGSAMILRLNGHTLTMNGTIYITKNGTSLTVADGSGSSTADRGGKIIGKTSYLFQLGESDVRNSSNSLLRIKSDTFAMKGSDGAIIAYYPNGSSGNATKNGLYIDNGTFQSLSGTCIYADEGKSASCMGSVTIKDGLFEAEDQCLSAGEFTNVSISKGSFYSSGSKDYECQAIEVFSGQFQDCCVFINGTKELGGSGTLWMPNHEGNAARLIQVAPNMNAFADVQAAVNSTKYGSVSVLNGKKALINAKLYAKATAKKGYYFVRWADSTGTTLTKSAALKMVVPDTSTVSVKALFKGDLSKASASLSTTKYAYNGKVRTPSVTVKNAAGTKLTKGTHYTVSYASGCKAVGAYKVTVKGKGSYGKSLTKSFKIVPAKPGIYTPSSASKGTLTVKASKKPTACGGKYYQVAYKQVGTSKWSKKNYSTQSVKLTKLKSGKAYYVKVRSYKKINGKTYFGAWSTTKKSGKVK